MSAAVFFARWRVRLSYPLAVVVLWLARPSPKGILTGAVVGAIGLWIRALAAGHLLKKEGLTTTRPYRYQRNPFYLVRFLLAPRPAIAAQSRPLAPELFL